MSIILSKTGLIRRLQDLGEGGETLANGVLFTRLGHDIVFTQHGAPRRVALGQLEDAIGEGEYEIGRVPTRKNARAAKVSAKNRAG